MSDFKRYVKFCKKFHNKKFPKIIFKELNETYKEIYKKFYHIEKEDIEKASFIIFLLSFLIILSLMLLFININILYIISFSFLISIFLSYKFSLVIYKDINKKESSLNALLYLIKINFTLIQKSLKKNTDFCLYFISLIKEFSLPLFDIFEDIFTKIHEGKCPENELLKITTPSEEFNNYLQNLIINNFDLQDDFVNIEDNSLERSFKIYLRDLESKISVIFFIGIFFPIGLCFFLILYYINFFFLFSAIFVFLVILNLSFKKFIKVNSFFLCLL
ncbi:MAG: hypothetical protein ACTSQJ_18905, partial [Promethearchaeota archaeon]